MTTKTEDFYGQVDALLDSLADDADGQTVESVNKQIADLTATRKAQKESQREKDAAASEAEAAETNAELIDTVFNASPEKDRYTLNKAAEKVAEKSAHLYEQIITSMSKGKTTGITIMPAVISANPAPDGMGAVPRLNIKNGPNPNADECEVHMYVRPEIMVSKAQLAMFPSHQIGYVGNVENEQGSRKQVTYSAVAGDIGALVNATGTGGVGAGQFPEGTTYVPIPELPRAFTGPMGNAMLWNVKVTPGDINPMKVLQITAESVATHPAVENKQDVYNPAPTDPTTGEIVIEASKIATNLRFTKEVTMKNYITGFEEVFGRQGLHKHLQAVNEAQTNGTGAGDPKQCKGIITAANAIAGIPDHEIAKAALASFAVDEVTYLELRALIKPGVRGGRMVYMAPDILHHRAMIRQYRNSAPGYPLMLDMSRADDANGILGRIFNGWVVSNEDMNENTDNATALTVGLVLEGDTFCVRTTGTTMVFNSIARQGLDQIECYVRTYVDGDFTTPQVAGEYSAGRLRTKV